MLRLTLRSSNSTTVIGCVSLAKSASGCGLPLSKIAKASRGRSGTSRPSGRVTVA